MLAKEIKKRNIKRQRHYIFQKLMFFLLNPQNDGNTAYVYTGYIFPEVIFFFDQEGFNVTQILCDNLDPESYGMPVYLFTIKDNLILTESENQAAESETVYFETENGLVDADSFGI